MRRFSEDKELLLESIEGEAGVGLDDELHDALGAGLTQVQLMVLGTYVRHAVRKARDDARMEEAQACPYGPHDAR